MLRTSLTRQKVNKAMVSGRRTYLTKEPQYGDGDLLKGGCRIIAE